MKRNKRRQPLPQHEFGFTPDTFNLFAEVSLDGERIAREQTEAAERRREAEARQAAFIHTEEIYHDRLTQNHPPPFAAAVRALPQAHRCLA